MKRIFLVALIIGLFAFKAPAGFAQEPAAESRPALGAAVESTFPVYMEGDYFDQAIYDQINWEFDQVRLIIFEWSTLFLLYTRNYLELKQFAELLNVTREGYPEGLGPVLVLYKTWRLHNPNLQDGPIFRRRLKDKVELIQAKVPERAVAVARQLEMLEEFIEKNEAYGRELDQLADSGLAAEGLEFNPDLAAIAKFEQACQTAALSFIYLHNSLNAIISAKLFEAVYKVSPEGAGAVLLIYKMRTLEEPRLEEVVVFRRKLEYMANQSKAVPPARLLSKAGEFMDKGRGAMRDLESFANWAGARWASELVKPARPEDESSLELPLHSILAADQFEDMARRLRASADPGTWSPVYHSHFSVPNPAEIIPLTRSLAAMQRFYGFTAQQMAAAAFALNAFIYEGLSGRVLLDNGLKGPLMHGLGQSRHGLNMTGMALSSYMAFQSTYYWELEHYLNFRVLLFLPPSARPEARDIMARLSHRQYDHRLRAAAKIADQIKEMNQKGAPADPAKKSEFLIRHRVKKIAIDEYLNPHQYRTRGSGYGQIY